MIKLLNNDKELNALNPFGIRIKALYAAYGGTHLCRFYQDTSSGAVLAIYGDLLIIDSAVTVSEEIMGFCSMLGVKTILCSGEFKLDKAKSTEGYILKYQTSERLQKQSDNIILFNDGFRKIYSLLSESFDSSQLDFSDFYVDISHKVRHGCACSALVYAGNTPVSCAVAPFVAGGGAVISAVCTDKTYRQMGFGRCALLSLIDNLNSIGVSDIYVQIEDHSLLNFYCPLGFNVAGTWQEIKL